MRAALISTLYMTRNGYKPKQRVSTPRDARERPIWHVKSGNTAGFYRSKHAKPGPCTVITGEAAAVVAKK